MKLFSEFIRFSVSSGNNENNVSNMVTLANIVCKEMGDKNVEKCYLNVRDDSIFSHAVKHVKSSDIENVISNVLYMRKNKTCQIVFFDGITYLPKDTEDMAIDIINCGKRIEKAVFYHVDVYSEVLYSFGMWLMEHCDTQNNILYSGRTNTGLKYFKRFNEVITSFLATVQTDTRFINEFLTVCENGDYKAYNLKNIQDIATLIQDGFMRNTNDLKELLNEKLSTSYVIYNKKSNTLMELRLFKDNDNVTNFIQTIDAEVHNCKNIWYNLGYQICEMYQNSK